MGQSQAFLPMQVSGTIGIVQAHVRTLKWSWCARRKNMNFMIPRNVKNVISTSWYIPPQGSPCYSLDCLGAKLGMIFQSWPPLKTWPLQVKDCFGLRNSYSYCIIPMVRAMLTFRWGYPWGYGKWKAKTHLTSPHYAFGKVKLPQLI